MNKYIDLTKILKDCPKGFELYSTIHGKVYFNLITKDKDYPICIKHNDLIHFTENGKYLVDEPNGECILFPSKEQRDWSKFIAPWYNKEKFNPNTLHPFDKVLVRDDYNKNWRCDIFSHIMNKDCTFKYITTASMYKFCIPYNNDTKHLIGTTEEAPDFYKCWKD